MAFVRVTTKYALLNNYKHMNSSFLRLNGSDFLKGAITAVIAGVIVTLAGVVQAPEFNVLNADWGAILTGALNSAITVFFSYLVKNLMTSEDGKIAGISVT